MQQNHSANAINLYPNPTQNQITIEVSETQLSDYVINIFDPIGTLITSKTSMQQSTQLDVSKFSCGIYSVQVISSKGVSNFSFVKE
nr:T9SS type A sorting domain-containing protein [Bacteroidota bacterium]